MTVQVVQESMIKKILWLAAISVLASPFVHPFGPVRQQSASSVPASVRWDDPRVSRLFERACLDCHSERTHWPLYSYLPLLSWGFEKDVADARQMMDLSRWGQYSIGEKRGLIAGIGAVVQSRQMPPPRYALMHPDARLSDAEIQAIYDWTKSQGLALRSRRE